MTSGNSRTKKEKSLRFVTWNTNGIKHPPKKFPTVLESLSNLKADIVFIQETHVEDNYQILTDVKDWKMYFTVHNSSSKGVAILIKNNVPFRYICHDEDCSGGYIVLFCHLYGELYTLVNVYKLQADRNVLGRLKEYLMETAEGVLVVGGDFNTVLHPRFDRSPSDSTNSPSRSILENFTVSLHLRDTWSHTWFAEEGFTHYQNKSHSRLDMFFMHSDTMRRVCDIKVEEIEISDHNPVVLDLEVQQQTGNNFPKVASLIENVTCIKKPIRISGKISGAEILSAIKTLSDSDEQMPGQRPVEYYKSHQCPITEILKIKYNNMLETNSVSEAFKAYHLSKDRRIFNVEYLILSQILAKRLSAYIFPYIKTKQETNLATFLTVKCDNIKQKIKTSFLETSLELESDWKKKLWSSEPPANFRILEHLLPEDQDSPGKLKHFVNECRLTNTILNLALNKLNYILNEETECRSSVCFQRQALLIHAHQSEKEKVVMLVKKFQEDSGIIFHIIPLDHKRD